MVDSGGLAMHETPGALHFAAIDGAETLVPQTNAKHRDFSSKVLDGLGRDTAILDRFTGTRRNDKVVRFEGDQLLQRDQSTSR
jgi:hypothetical protein